MFRTAPPAVPLTVTISSDAVSGSITRVYGYTVGSVVMPGEFRVNVSEVILASVLAVAVELY
jgi:hypothetical protein